MSCFDVLRPVPTAAPCIGGACRAAGSSPRKKIARPEAFEKNHWCLKVYATWGCLFSSDFRKANWQVLLPCQEHRSLPPCQRAPFPCQHDRDHSPSIRRTVLHTFGNLGCFKALVLPCAYVDCAGGVINSLKVKLSRNTLSLSSFLLLPSWVVFFDIDIIHLLFDPKTSLCGVS